MCQHVAIFMAEHTDRKLKAFFSHQGRNSFGLFLMTETEVYDFDLSDKLADFAGPYIERGLLDSVTLLPACSPDELTAFFDPTSAVRIEIDHA